MWDLEFNQKLLFVTGKGGTGKSFLTSILGVRLAREGKKVLLIDSEATGALAEQFEHEPVGYDPVEVAENIYVLQSSTDDALAQYLHLYAKIPTWAKITPLARVIDLVANAAPGVREILITGKVCYEAKKVLDGESEFDVIIVDAPSSGHVISLLDAPRALAELVSRGMIQTQTQWMQNILHSSETGVVVVTTTDDVVLSETQDLLKKIASSTNVSVSGVIINKDMADLRHKEVSKVNEGHHSAVIERALHYYVDLITQTRKVVSVFEGYDLYAFPFLSDTLPSLRAIMKNEDSFGEVDRDAS